MPDWIIPLIGAVGGGGVVGAVVTLYLGRRKETREDSGQSHVHFHADFERAMAATQAIADQFEERFNKLQDRMEAMEQRERLWERAMYRMLDFLGDQRASALEMLRREFPDLGF